MQKLYFLILIICVAAIAGCFGYMNGQMNRFNQNLELEQEIKLLKSKLELKPEEPYLAVHGAALGRRGNRGHAAKADEWNADTILEDYSHVGIKISRHEAEQIYKALRNYTTPGISSRMRAAALDFYANKVLDAKERDLLMQYSLVIEYTRIAPPYPDDKMIYKGFANNSKYIKNLYELKSGDKFELDMPTDFDTREAHERAVAGRDGVVIAIDGGIKNGISLSGFSVNFPDYDVLVSDKGFTVSNVSNISGDASEDICKTIFLKVK